MMIECIVCGTHAVVPLRTHDLIEDQLYFRFCTTCRGVAPITRKEYLELGAKYVRVKE